MSGLDKAFIILQEHKKFLTTRLMKRGNKIDKMEKVSFNGLIIKLYIGLDHL